MNKHISKLLIIILMAVLFVPLISNNEALANNFIIDEIYYQSNGYVNGSGSITIPDDGDKVIYVKIKKTNIYEDKNITVHAGIRMKAIGGTTKIWGEVGGAEDPSAMNYEAAKLLPGESSEFLVKIEQIGNEIYVDGILNAGGLTAPIQTINVNDGSGVHHVYEIEIFKGSQLEINSRPVLEHPYYIMYCNEDYSWIRMQSYNEIPIFTVGDYKDPGKNEYDIKWVGRGPMIKYNWQIPPGGGIGVEEWVKSGGANEGVIFEDDGAERKIILETNHAINIGSEHIPPIGQGREISEQDPFFELISHQDPIETVYEKIRIQVQLGDNIVSAKGMPEGLADIYVNGAEYEIISREWKGYKIDNVGMLMSQYFYNEIITIDLYIPFAYGQYKTIGITAVIPEEKQYLLNIRERKEYKLNFQVYRYEFIDEDEDGIDDNTGETGNWNYDNDVPGYSDGQNPPDPGNYDPGILGQIRYLTDTIGYWIMTPFRLLAEGFTYVLEQVNSVFGWASNFSIMIGSLFSFLPGPVVSLIGLSFVAIIVVTLIKAVRG